MLSLVTQFLERRFSIVITWCLDNAIVNNGLSCRRCGSAPIVLLSHSEFRLSTRFVVYLIGTLTGLPFRCRSHRDVGEWFPSDEVGIYRLSANRSPWVPLEDRVGGVHSTMMAYLSYRFKRLYYSLVSTSFYFFGTNI